MLTQARLKELIEYEPDSGHFYWIARTARSNVRAAGCISKDGYLRIGIDDNDYLGQRLAWLYMYGHWPNYIDHINGIRSDNRIANLRNVTKSQDQANRPYGPNRGIEIRGNSYRVRIKVNGSQIQLGSYSDIDTARNVYREAADRYFGEFAHHNRPVE